MRAALWPLPSFIFVQVISAKLKKISFIIQLLFSDIDGFGTIDEHGQLLIEYKRLQEKPSEVSILPNIAAGRKYSRRILTAIWDYIISICTKVLSNSASQEIKSNLGAFLGSKRAKSSQSCFKEAQQNNIKVLQSLLRVSKKVGFQNLSGSIFCLLSNEVCRTIPKDKKKKNPKFNCESILALESVLSNGLELASHSQVKQSNFKLNLRNRFSGLLETHFQVLSVY